MRIERSIKKNGTLAPSAINLLRQIQSQHQFLHERARRSPLAVYNVSVEQLLSDFVAVLDAYQETADFIATKRKAAPGGDTHYESLLAAQKSLIHSLQAHIDDCYSILASLVDPTTVRTNASTIRFTDKWLDRVGFPTILQFRDAVSECRNDRLAPLVNGLKHRQNRLRGLYFENANEVRLGYYLEEPDVNGVIGPSAAIHEDSNSAFSFAKDLRLAAFNVYRLSEALVDAVSGALRHYHGVTLQPELTKNENDNWSSVIGRVVGIKPLVFPDEIDKPYPYFSLTKDHEDTELVMIYPVTLIPLRFPQGMKINWLSKGDGVSRTFRIPYVKPSKYGRAL